MSDLIQLPTTVDGAVRYLRGRLSCSTIAQLRLTPREELGHFHFSLGMWIRNNLRLWHENTALVKATGESHPDDASMVIITALWDYLQVNRLEAPDR